MVAGDGVAAHPVDHRLGARSGLEPALLDLGQDHLVAVELEDLHDVGLAVLGVDPARVGYLSAGFGVERRLAQLERDQAFLQFFQVADRGVKLVLLVAHEVSLHLGAAAQLGEGLPSRIPPRSSRKPGRGRAAPP